MHKKILNYKSKAPKFMSDEEAFNFFQGVIDDLAIDHDDADDESTAGQLMTSTTNAAIALTRLVIENRLNNAQKITDEDIYEIYKTSLHTVMRAQFEFPIG